MAQFKIGGAGISGLTTAINLAKNDNEVVVYEKQSTIGNRPITYQGILYPSGVRNEKEMENYLKKHKIKMNFHRKILKNGEIVLDNGKQIELEITDPDFMLVQRGGKKSIEYALYRQTKHLNINFNFNSDIRQHYVDITATGPSRTDGIGTGAVYEGANFPKDKFLIMFDDRFSPKGCYLWINPHTKNRIELMICVSQPWVSQVKKFYQKVINEHPRISEILDGAEKLYDVGGRGNCYIPNSAKKQNSLYVGEAAGFQDPFMGFGIMLAIKSGFLAAKSLNENLDYDRLWKSVLLPKMKQNFIRRFFTSIFGSKIISLVMDRGPPRRTIKNIEQIRGKLPTIELLSKIQIIRTNMGYK